MSFPRYPKYKDSSVEWLGEVPEHWGVQPLKTLASHNDDLLPEDTPPDYEINYVDISGVEAGMGIKTRETMPFSAAPSRARRRVQHGDVIVSTVRTYLRAIARIVDPESNLVVSTGFAAIRPRQALCAGFAGYMLSGNHFIEQVIARSTGVSYPAINASELVGIPALLPPPNEQAAIASFLDRETAKIDALIAEQQRLIELLQEKRQAVISHAVTKGLNPDAPMKASGIEWLGEVPEHWAVGPLKHFVRREKGAIKTGPFGSQLTAADMEAGEYRVYTQRNVLDEDCLSGDAFINDVKFEQMRAFETFPGDVLVTTRGTIGRVTIVPPEASQGILHPCVLRIQPDTLRLDARFRKMLIQDSEAVRSQLAFLSNATTIEVIYSNTMAAVVVPIPPRREQEDIIHYLGTCLAEWGRLLNEATRAITLLQERRSALISAAVTGQIDVRGLEPTGGWEAA